MKMGAGQRVSELCPAAIFDDDLYVLPADVGEQTATSSLPIFPLHCTSLLRRSTKSTISDK